MTENDSATSGDGPEEAGPRSSRLSRSIVGGQLAVLIWIVLSCAALVAFLFWSDPLRNVAIRMQPLLTALIVLAAATGIGWTVSRRDLLFSAAAGMGALAVGVLLWGVLFPLDSRVLLTVVGLGVILFAIALLRDRPWRNVHAGSGPWSTLGWAGLTAMLISLAPFVVSPDISTDSLQYHLLIPRLYLEQGRISYLPLFVESNYPSLAEYIYVVILAIGDDIAAKSFHFLVTMLALLAIRRLARQLVPDSDGVLAAALFFVMPVAAITSGWALNDMIFTFFLLLSLSQLLEGRMVAAGLLFGLATFTKYTYVLALFPFGVMLLYGLRLGRWRWADIGKFSMAVVAVSSIWMIKNATLTGNPFYPFLNEIFQSPYWGPAADSYLKNTLTRYEFPDWNWTNYFYFPALLTLKPSIVDAHPGPLPLILLPLVFLRGGDKQFSLLRAFLAGAVLGWLIIQTEMRSLLFVVAVLAVMFATVISRRPFPFLKPIIAIAFTANIWLTFVVTGYLTRPIPFFIGLQSGSEFLETEPRQKLYLWLNREPSVGGALFVGLHDPYHFHKPMLFSSCCDKPVAQVLVEQSRDALGLASVLRGNGITHVAVDRSEYSRQHVERLYSWNAQQREVFRTFLAQACRPVTMFGDILVFQLIK